jgi:hypothetical protein
MKETLIRFTWNLTILSTIVAVIGAGIYFMLPRFATPALPWLILFFIITTYTLYSVLLKASTGKFNRFTNLFMAASVFKLLLLLVVITLYMFFFRSDAIRFVITMFVLYLVYTVFEVIWLLKINKTK